MFNTNDKIFKNNLKSNMVTSIVIEFVGIMVLIVALTGAVGDLQSGFRNGDILGFLLMFGGIALVVFPIGMLVRTMQFKQFFEETGLEEATIEEFQRFKATGKVTAPEEKAKSVQQ